VPDIREDQQPKIWALLFSEDQGKRLSAVDALGKVTVEWPVAWLALLLADPSASVANSAYQAIRKRGKNVLPLLSLQRLSPQPKVRQASIRLIGEFGDLTCVHDVIPALFDPVVDVREEGRKAVESMVSRSVADAAKEPRNLPILREAMTLFASLSSVPQRNARTVMISSFMALAVESQDIFWELLATMEPQARGAIEHEILSRPNLQRIDILYHGLVAGRPQITERAIQIIDRLINKDNISGHVESLSRLGPKKKEMALEILSEKGLITTLFEYFAWVRRDLKTPFLGMFEYEFGEKYFKQLLALLQDPNPQIVSRLIENFLTFEEELPSHIVRDLLKHPSPVVRKSGIHYLHLRGRQESVRLLMPLLKEDDPKIIRLAGKAIGRISQNYLIDHFGEIPPRERRSLTHLLQRIDSGFVEGLADLLGSHDEEDRLHLTMILADLADDPAAGDAIDGLMSDQNGRIRAAAVRGFEKLDPERLDEESIAHLFSDPDPRVRANLIESLPLEKKKAWVEKIEEAARSKAPRERGNAVLALYQLGKGEAEIALMQMLRHPDSWMRTSGLWVLGQVDLPHLMFKALELCDDPSNNVRIHALRAIGRKGNPDLARQISPYLRDPSEEVREAAQIAIQAQSGMQAKV
jgi:HEAT repeat protein